VSNGVTDGHQTMDRPSNPNLLHSQMGYIIPRDTNRHQQTPTDTSRHQVQIQTAFVNIYTYKNVFVENSNADVALQLFQKNIFVYVFTT
jgi:hypothetical protein